MVKTLIPATLVIFLTVAGCVSSQYAYKPAETAMTGGTIQEGAVYKIPSQAEAEGQIRILSYGVADFEPKEGASEMRVLHLRIALDNQQAENWVMDVRDQTLSLPGEGRSRAAYVNTDSDRGEFPLITVLPGERKLVDLYYPLPAGLQEASEIPGFQVHWELSTAKRRIRKDTPFERFVIRERHGPIRPYAARSSGIDPSLGAAPHWWYNYDYAHWTWYHPISAAPLS